MKRGAGAWLAGLAAGLLAAGCSAVYTIGGEGTSSGTGGTCGDGEIACDGACVDPERDPLHCGGCGEVCPAGESCAGGTCTKACGGSCEDGREVCDGNTCACRDGLVRCGGDCIDPNADPDHCGGCNEACDGDRMCSAGACVAGPCPAGTTACDGACVDLAADPLHCGSCDTECRSAQVCVAGVCQDAWPSPCDACPCEACGARACCEVMGEPTCVAGSACPGP